MRLSTDDGRDTERAIETIAAAAAAGVTVFDTAHAYGIDAAEAGHNERLLAGALRSCGAERSARIATKGGMTRAGGGWVADGRARAILTDCESSLAMLDGLPIDLYLLHAPDPRTPWPTSVRALARLLDEGMVRRVGLANVNRRQLDEAMELTTIAAIQVPLSVYDHSAIRGGLVDRCTERRVALIAHSPLGGPRRASRLARHPALMQIASARAVTAAEVALAWVLDVSPTVLAIPGARRPDTARSAARAATLQLDVGDRAALAHAFGTTATPRPERRQRADAADVTIVMGIPGAGKSRIAAEYVARGYVRLNRDERGGTLRDIADALDRQLASGVHRIVLDNTYLTRAARSYAIESAGRHQTRIRCVWADTPLAQAQINLVERLLERVGFLPNPDDLRALARREPGVLMPGSQMRALRELEPPTADEGFAAVDHIAFARTPYQRARPGVFIAAAALRGPGWQSALTAGDRSAPHLVFDWSPDGTGGDIEACAARLRGEISGPVESAICAHAGGPPTCWCRPPLPGLPLAFARALDVDPSRSILLGAGPAHRTLANALGARYVAVEQAPDARVR